MAARQETPNVHEVAMHAMAAIISSPKLYDHMQDNITSTLKLRDIVAKLAYKMAEDMITEGQNH